MMPPNKPLLLTGHAAGSPPRSTSARRSAGQRSDMKQCKVQVAGSRLLPPSIGLTEDGGNDAGRI